MSELVCRIWQQACYGWLQERPFHMAEMSFKYRANDFPLFPQILALPKRLRPCWIFLRPFFCLFLIHKMLGPLYNITVSLKLWECPEKRLFLSQRFHSTVSQLTAFPNFFPHMWRGPFMCFQNQNRAKEPNLKVLSWHDVNVMTHFTLIGHTEIMMNGDTNKLIKMQGQNRKLGLTSKYFRLNSTQKLRGSSMNFSKPRKKENE